MFMEKKHVQSKNATREKKAWEEQRRRLDPLEEH